jgi:hypothetical protein
MFGECISILNPPERGLLIHFDLSTIFGALLHCCMHDERVLRKKGEVLPKNYTAILKEEKRSVDVKQIRT